MSRMELEVFIQEIADRILMYLEAADKPGKVADPIPHNSHSKTTDHQLPLEGNGMNAVLDDIDTYLR